MSRFDARRTWRAAALGACIALSAACETDRATVTDPIGERILQGRLVPDGRNLPGGTVAFNEGMDSLVITISGVEELATGAYHVWLANTADDALADVVPATGSLRISTADTTFNAEGDPEATVSTVDRGNVSTFTEGGANVTIRLAVPFTAAAEARTRVLVTIEETDNATAPTASGPRPLFAELSDLYAEDVAEQALSFGTFDPRGDGDSSYVFVPTGRGFANFIGRTLTVADSALMRPPVGYYYATSLIGRNETSQAVDTLIVGEQTAPAPRRSVSLRNADVQTVDPVVIPAPQPQILAAANRLDATGTTPFAGFNEVVIHLETKQGVATVAPTYVLVAPVPGVVATPPETQ